MSPSPASLPVDGRDPEVFARLWARVSRPGATPIIPLSAQTPPPEVPAVPAVQPEPAPRGAWMSLLRQAFAAEQRAAGGYRAAAAETADPALRALYEELSGDEARHAGLLLALLERL